MRTQLSNGRTRLYGGKTAVRAAVAETFDKERHNLLFSIDPADTAGWTIGGGDLAEEIVESSSYARAIPAGGSGLETTGGIIYGNSGAVGIIIGDAVPAIAAQVGPVCWVSVERPATLGTYKRFALYTAGQYIRFNAGGVAIGQFSFDNGQINFPTANVAGTKYAFIVQRDGFDNYEAHRWNGSSWVSGTSTFNMNEDVAFAAGDECEFGDNDEAFLIDMYGKHFTGQALADLKEYLETR